MAATSSRYSFIYLGSEVWGGGARLQSITCISLQCDHNNVNRKYHVLNLQFLKKTDTFQEADESKRVCCLVGLFPSMIQASST